MLRCLSKFGQITTRPSFNKPVQIRKSLFVQPRLFTRNASGFKSDGALPFSRVYGDKEGEGKQSNLIFAYRLVNSFFPKSDQKDDDFSFINSGLFAGDVNTLIKQILIYCSQLIRDFLHQQKIFPRKNTKITGMWSIPFVKTTFLLSSLHLISTFAY